MHILISRKALKHLEISLTLSIGMSLLVHPTPMKNRCRQQPHQLPSTHFGRFFQLCLRLDLKNNISFVLPEQYIYYFIVIHSQHLYFFSFLHIKHMYNVKQKHRCTTFWTIFFVKAIYLILWGFGSLKTMIIDICRLSCFGVFVNSVKLHIQIINF